MNLGPNYYNFWVITGFMPPVGSLCHCITLEKQAHPEQFHTSEIFLKKMCHNFPGDWCPPIFPGGDPRSDYSSENHQLPTKTSSCTIAS